MIGCIVNFLGDDGNVIDSGRVVYVYDDAHGPIVYVTSDAGHLRAVPIRYMCGEGPISVILDVPDLPTPLDNIAYTLEQILDTLRRTM